MIVRAAVRADIAEWLRMRSLLWPHCSENEHLQEIEQWLSDLAISANFVLAKPDGSLGGFLEASLRETVERFESSPVGYIEGWYVDPSLRGKGWGRKLAAAAEDWAKQHGAAEMGSDTETEREVSILAHRAIGYEELERVVRFRKLLVQG